MTIEITEELVAEKSINLFCKKKENIQKLREVIRLYNIIEDTRFGPALKKVMKVRAERAKIYGHGWKTDEDWELLAEIYQKSKRLKRNIIDNNSVASTYESTVDNLIDITNYSLFLLQNILDRNIKEENKKND